MTENQGWVYQGRQSHGWFGNGTAPDVGTASGAEAANPVFRPANAGQRVDWAVSSLIAQTPRAARSTWNAAAADATRERLKTAVGAMFLAIFAAFGRPDVGALVVGVLLAPVIGWAWFDHARLEARAATYLRERAELDPSTPPPTRAVGPGSAGADRHQR